MKRLRNARLVALMAVGLALASCSQLPTAPKLENEAPPASAAVSAPAATLAASHASRTIVGLLGGVVSAGDFTLVVPPLAITGKATITVDQADLSTPVVELSITPASANRFRLPVLLIGRANKLSPQLLSVAYISCFNPATEKWERVPGCSVSLLNLTVTAPLSHFSTYRIEVQNKAGW